MTLSPIRGARRSVLLLAGGLILAVAPAWAQDVDGPDPLPEPQNSRTPPGAIVQSLDAGPGAELRRNLTTLAANPRSVDALVGAGRAALGTGDGQAALGFFTRAQELAPNDPRAKAGMASALVLSERPESALVTFGEALQLGAPVEEIAGDRGLAYDMVGDPRRAQQDYTTYLRRHPDPEVERRLALSFAISGQREAAQRVIDAQLRRNDRAAWRTQAFILALTGDARGADDTASRLMPAANAQAMSPFFSRLASLSPAQKAAAVHFGRFPGDGRATQMASNIDTRADPGALAMVGLAPQPGAQFAQRQPQRQAGAAEPTQAPPRRRPTTYERSPNSLIRRPDREFADAVLPVRQIETAQAATGRFAPPRPEDDPYARQDPARESMPQPQPSHSYAGPRPREAPAFAPGANFTLDTRHEAPVPPGPPVTFAPPQQAPLQSYQRVQPGVIPPQPRQTFTLPPVISARQSPARPSSPRPAFSDIASVIDALPGDEAPAAMRTPTAARTETAAERRARDATAREAEARYRQEGSSAAPSRRSGASISHTHGRPSHDADAATHEARNRSGRRHGADDEASGTSGHARHGHDAHEETAASRSRDAHGRRTADSSRNGRGRSARSHDEADDTPAGRPGRNRRDRGHGDANDAGSTHSAHGRPSHGRIADEDSHASRSAHPRSTHTQRDADEPRAARSRSSPQQRPAVHPRRSH